MALGVKLLVNIAFYVVITASCKLKRNYKRDDDFVVIIANLPRYAVQLYILNGLCDTQKQCTV